MTGYDTCRAVEEIERLGFTLVAGVLSADTCRQVALELQGALEACADDATSLRRQNGVIYGARDLLEVFPAARTFWQVPPLTTLLEAVLGQEYGLVRGLFFDKPPQGNWSLPWHQDLTIAVRDHSGSSERCKNRTLKAGVPHVEAPREVLDQMLTLRIHLDEVTDENGPLQVLPGSHHEATENSPPQTIYAAAGDVLAIRPLVSHASGPSRPNTARHRRIIHLEFAGCDHLPDGYQWRHFVRPESCQGSTARSD